MNYFYTQKETGFQSGITASEIAYFKQQFSQFNDLIEQKKLDLNDLQKNFVFNFEKTGHSVHDKRAKELLKPIQVFLGIVESMEFHKPKL